MTKYLALGLSNGKKKRYKRACKSAPFEASTVEEAYEKAREIAKKDSSYRQGKDILVIYPLAGIAILVPTQS